ncbi:hypothetical protein [Actinomadura sp. NPDC000600]|uniref:hypothetical protein n=1 Tax=Actinomadura sp. NPDC000600 TaxID=3154262 RepID=UPI0033990145
MLQPTPEAVEWGKRQAAKSPQWSDAKWKRIGALLGVQLLANDGRALQEQDEGTHGKGVGVPPDLWHRWPVQPSTTHIDSA